ncbi:MAG: Ribonucleoside-diphosphate reductase, partial [Candidatus Angelobacter sp.]|nr:Ribonucleoside-diphosphate reductase [Candidatus Angelobacter sp.]
EFDVPAYRHAVDVMITAQEILVDNAGYPTEAIARNSHDYRPLGLGYANLGALLMASGLPYDSDTGRDYAACVTAIMCGEAYLQSARIAGQCPQLGAASSRVSPQDVTGGACPGWYSNREPFLDVIRMHRASVNKINKENVPAAVLEGSRQSWDEALALGERNGYRNAQVTVLAPTGTIGFMMDCDTTGVEPDLALVKYKKLVGGGMIKIVNQTVPSALWKLGYTPDQVNSIVGYIDSTGTIEGAPGIREEHLPVFDCSFKPQKGTRTIHYMGHVMMMAATQPFISGAISKTVNLPESATIEDITEAYLQSWKLGLKAVAIYRDGSKKAQPLMAASSRDEAARRGTRGERDVTTTQRPLSGPELDFQKLSPEQQTLALAAVKPLTMQQQESAPPRAVRHRLPSERASITHKFALAGHEGYITVGLYKDGTPGELFIRMAKEGSTVSGLMDSFATAVSLALQHGVPMKLLCDKFSHTRFEPSGFTGNPEIPIAKSIMDYIFRWLELRFVTGRQYPLFKDMVLPGAAALSSEPLAISEGSAAVSTQHSAFSQTSSETTPPQGGLANSQKPAAGSSPSIVDRGIYHSADALKEFVDLGDAPTCSVCGSIMTRNGSCYRCMSCGSTSGCS